MTALRFALLSVIALSLATIGGILWFDPVPAAPAPPLTTGPDVLLASGASLGVGLLLPQLAVAVPSFGPGSNGPPVLVALASRKTPTPTAVSAGRPTGTPGPSSTPEPTDTPGPTDTPAPTRTPVPTRTPAPTRTPMVSALVGCGDINQPGAFTLGASLSSQGDCLNIRSNNVVLDCKGLNITNSTFNGYGIAVRLVGLIPQQTNNVEIRNCNVSGFRYGIYVEGSTNIYLHDNTVSGNFSDVDGRRYGNFLGMAEGGGIRLNNTSGGRVENNTTNDQAIGIDVRGSSNIKVRGNQSSNNTAWGVNLWSTSSSEVSGNTTNGNIRYCTWGAGVVGAGCDAGGIAMQYGSSGNLVTNNQVGTGNGNGIFIKAHAMPCGNNNVIANNTIVGSLYNGIEIGFCTGTQIVGNSITNGLDGIWMGFAVNTTIKNNTIQNQSNHGIISNHSHDNVLSNNTLINDDEALYLYWEPVNPSDFGWLNVDQYHSFNNTISGNIINNNIRAGIHLKNSTDNQITGNTLSNNPRNYWLEGNSSGNNISGNNPNSWQLLPEFMLALAAR
jgi:parallel beta-helix repeat protein